MTRRLVLACAAAALCLAAGRVGAGTGGRVLSSPSPVLEWPRRGAAVVTIAPRGTALELVGRENDWCWVLIPPQSYGTRRAGWLRCTLLEEPGVPIAATGPAPPPAALPAIDSTAVVEDRVVARGGPFDAALPREAPTPFPSGSTGRRASSTSKDTAPGNPGAPPTPVGMDTRPARSSLATWIQPRMLRASVAAGYEASQNGSAGAVSDDRIAQGAFTVATSFAILDPRVATIDFSGDFQTGRNNRSTQGADYHNGNTLTGYRFDASFLSGRSAPLRVFSDRISNDASMVPLTPTLDPSQFTYSVRTSTGFTWNVAVPNRPHVQVSASRGHQSDERNYLFGYSSFNDEQRADVRVTQDLGFGRYDVNYTYGRFVYDVPDAKVRTDTGNDLLFGTLHLQPRPRLSFDVGGRMSRYRFDLTGRTNNVTGYGGDLAGRYRFSPKLSASGRYAFSSNAFEAVLSGAIPVQDPRTESMASPTAVATNTYFQDADGRVEYGTSRTSVAAIARFTAYGVPAWQPVTLGGLRTLGLQARAERQALGFSFTGSVDASAGTASSNRSQSEPYREAGFQAGLSREWSQRFRLSADGGLRGVSRLPFYPVNLDSRSLTGAIDTSVPAWARVRLAVTWTNNLRDILYNDNRDQHAGYTMSISGRWYDVSVDVNRLSTRSLLLPSDVLGGRPDVALLLASNPEMYRNVLGSADHSRALTIGLRPWRGLQVNGRIVRQSQEYPTLYNLLQEGEQVWAVWQIRELQLEAGWERLESTSSFTVINGRRFYFRVRRDLTFF